jgi:D-alanyl-D-alanine carboxypeptidase
MIIKKYYLSMKLDLMVVKEDEEVGGYRMKVEDEDMISLEDCVYGMMVGGANNAATILTNNLGSLVQKKREGRYFSCFDVGRESRDKNMEAFVELMKGHAEQLKLLDTTIKTPHGPLNTSTPHNIALLLSECLTIPLFTKVASTKAWTVRRKYINCNG